ncbi:MAG: PTS transporter subunit EIIB, partial [Longicatena sp.]
MAKKEKYEDLANSVVDLIGGKDNVMFFTHCVTRLRFNLKDQSVVKTEQIECLEGVIGVQWQNGQLQIIIGQAVGDAYKLICEKSGLKEVVAVNENNEEKKEKGF